MSERPRRSFLGLLLALFPALLAAFKIINRDIGFHVATGRAIALNGAVPRTNILSFTNPEHPWILHQWIPAWLFYQIDRLFGPAGLVVLKVMVIYLTWLFLWLALRRRGGRLGVSILFFLLSAATAFPRFYVRPYIFSFLLLAIFLWGLTAWSHPDARLRRRYRILTMIVGAVSAGIHVGFVYLWIVAAGVAGVAILEALVGAGSIGAVLRSGPGRRALAQPVLWIMGLGLLAAVLVSIVNPYGLGVLLLPFTFSLNPYWHEHLVEYRPPPFDLLVFPGLWCLLALSLAAGLASLLVPRLREKCTSTLQRAGWLLVPAYAALLLRHSRIAFAFALVAPVFASAWVDALLDLVPAARLRRVLVGLGVALGLLIAGRSLVLWSQNANPGFGRDEHQYPERLFAFIQRNELPDPAWISDSWGGYWLWRFYPDRRVFYDNRLEAYPFEFYRDVYQAIRYGEPGWQEKLQGIPLVVLRYSTPGERRFLDGRPGLRRLLFESPEWRLVYWDDLGEIFVRRDRSQACAACGDFHLFEPDSFAVHSPGPAAVMAELKDVLKRCGPSGRTYAAMAMVARLAGRPALGREWLRKGLEEYPDNPMVLNEVRRYTAAATARSP